ncbi:MAG TPA: hypothetical protein VFR58_15280, partial [Flavisolibacter sp.]|nr:hypothetical protein [Flavisolibacter sp.]
IRNDRFEMRFNERFYKVTPDVLIKDHMPFDPVYQFLSYPLSHKEFIESSPATGKTWFNYKDSLQHHLSLSAMEQRSAELRRLEAAGIQNDQLLKRQLYLKKSLQHFASRDASEEGRQLFKTASDTYKEFLVHKNKQFSTASETELRSMLDSMMQSIKAARALLTELEPKTDQQRQFKAGNLSSLDRLWAQLTREREFVDQYFATEPDKRKLMFAKKQTN